MINELRPKRKIRILTVCGELGEGGDSHRILYMAKTINRDLFHYVTVALLRPVQELDRYSGNLVSQFLQAGIDTRNLEEENPNLNARSRTYLGKLWNSAGFLLRCVKKLCKLIDELDIDVIDAHNGAGSLIGDIAAIIMGRPRLVTEYHVGPPAPMPMWPLLGRFYLSTANAVVTDSLESAKMIRKWILRRNPKVVVIPNGILPPETSLNREEARSMLGLPSDPNFRVIGQVGALKPHKGPRILLEAARTVLNSEAKTAFLLVGYINKNSDFRDQLMNEARELGILDRVRILTYPGWIGDVWAAIDIHVHASLFDSLPNAIIEGMSLGKPAVVTSVGGVPTLVENERTGLVVPPNDPVALSVALLRLLKNQQEAQQFGRAARRRYLERYRPDITTKRFEELFITVAEHAGRRNRHQSVLENHAVSL